MRYLAVTVGPATGGCSGNITWTTGQHQEPPRRGYPWQRRLNALRAMQRRRWARKHPEGPSRFMQDFMRDLRFVDREK